MGLRNLYQSRTNQIKNYSISFQIVVTSSINFTSKSFCLLLSSFKVYLHLNLDQQLMLVFGKTHYVRLLFFFFKTQNYCAFCFLNNVNKRNSMLQTLTQTHKIENANKIVASMLCPTTIKLYSVQTC